MSTEIQFKDAVRSRNSKIENRNYSKKLPAHGKALTDRLKFSNTPYLIAVCVGGDSWGRAKEWNQRPDMAALVLTPGQSPKSLQWTVRGCFTLVEWGCGAGEQLIIELVTCLLFAGALSVTVRPLWIDVTTPIGHFDKFGNWTQTRECIRTYFSKKAVLHVA